MLLELGLLLARCTPVSAWMCLNELLMSQPDRKERNFWCFLSEVIELRLMCLKWASYLLRIKCVLYC